VTTAEQVGFTAWPGEGDAQSEGAREGINIMLGSTLGSTSRKAKRRISYILREEEGRYSSAQFPLQCLVFLPPSHSIPHCEQFCCDDGGGGEHALRMHNLSMLIIVRTATILTFPPSTDIGRG